MHIQYTIKLKIYVCIGIQYTVSNSLLPYFGITIYGNSLIILLTWSLSCNSHSIELSHILRYINRRTQGISRLIDIVNIILNILEIYIDINVYL